MMHATRASVAEVDLFDRVVLGFLNKCTIILVMVTAATVATLVELSPDFVHASSLKTFLLLAVILVSSMCFILWTMDVVRWIRKRCTRHRWVDEMSSDTLPNFVADR